MVVLGRNTIVGHLAFSPAIVAGTRLPRPPTPLHDAGEPLRSEGPWLPVQARLYDVANLPESNTPAKHRGIKGKTFKRDPHTGCVDRSTMSVATSKNQVAADVITIADDGGELIVNDNEDGAPGPNKTRTHQEARSQAKKSLTGGDRHSAPVRASVRGSLLNAIPLALRCFAGIFDSGRFATS
ncbi:hypothetical protein PYCC9005_005190 [Savitreella phatthalungensis]